MQNISKIVLPSFLKNPFKNIRHLSTKKQCSKPILLDPTSKLALITGGTGEIGMTIAQELLTKNVRKVVLADIDFETGLKAVKELECMFGSNKAEFMVCDVTLKQRVKDCLERVVKDLGKIDIIVNSAGKWDGLDWENEIHSNLFGVISTNIYAQNFMNPNGIIINLSGIKGLQSFSHSPTLSASFSGVISATRCFGHKSNTEKTKIRVVCLCVGLTKTQFNYEAELKQLTPEMGKDVLEFLDNSPKQSLDPIKTAVNYLLKYADTGTVWVSDSYKLFSLTFPSWKCFANVEARFD